LPLLPLQISHRMAWDEPGSPLGQSGEWLAKQWHRSLKSKITLKYI
jgi:hypothetical protein